MDSHRFGRKCAICGKRKLPRTDMLLTSFPLDPDRCRLWVKAAGIEDFVYLPIEKLNQLKYVCDAHFDRDCFSVNGKRLLKNAVPTLKLTRPQLSDDIFTEFPLHVKSYYDKKKTGPSISSCKASMVKVDAIRHDHDYLLKFQEQTQDCPAFEEESTYPARDPIYVELLPEGNIDAFLIQDNTHSPVDPLFTQEYGPDINKQVASGLAHIATSGLDKEIRKDLIKKYLVPSNCTSIDAPQLNLEIKEVLTEQAVKKDEAIESRQKQTAAGLSALGKVISDQLLFKYNNIDLIKGLMDVGRIFCDIQYLESETRRKLSLSTVKKEQKEQLSKTKIDKYLFGSNFTETLKIAKGAKSFADSEAEKQPKMFRYLNWQPPARPPRHHQPPAPQRTSTHTYRQRPKQTRRQ